MWRDDWVGRPASGVSLHQRNGAPELSRRTDLNQLIRFHRSSPAPPETEKRFVITESSTGGRRFTTGE